MKLLDAIKKRMNGYRPDATWEKEVNDLEKPLPDDVLTRAIQDIPSGTILHSGSLRIEISKHGHHHASVSVHAFDSKDHSVQQWEYYQGVQHIGLKLFCKQENAQNMSLDDIARAIQCGTPVASPVQTTAIKHAIIEVLNHHFETYYGDGCTFRVHTIRKAKNNTYVTIPVAAAEQSNNVDRAHKYNIEKAAANWILSWARDYIPEYFDYAVIKEHLLHQNPVTLDNAYDTWKIQWEDWYAVHKNLRTTTPLDLDQQDDHQP